MTFTGESVTMEICARMQEDEFLDFYNTYSGAVTRVAIRFLGDEGEALCVTDSTMWYAFCHPDKFRGMDRATVKSYLLRIVYTTSINHIRRRSRIIVLDDDVLDCIGHSADRESIEGCIESDELRDIINKCVDSMPEVYRETVLMRLFGGMTLVEISQRLSIPLDTAKSRWRRGRIMLRESICTYLS